MKARDRCARQQGPGLFALEIEEESGFIRNYHLLNATVGRALLSTEP